uniref:CUE domain-containing protein n=1 Tax=Caenorhabditis tropicalis TaxID=1561998 RepID=A0A1I7T1C8_9PELO
MVDHFIYFQVLQRCASKLPWIVRSPDTLAARIIAVGLVRKNILTGSPNSSAAEIGEEDQMLSANLRVVLNAIVYYGKNKEFCNLVSDPDLSDRIKIEISDWAFLEAVEFKRIISDRVVSLFQGSTSALSPLAEDTLQQGIRMFDVVHEFLRRCSKCIKESNHLENYALSTKCLFNHTKLVKQFINARIVPVNDHIELLMRQKHEKKKGITLKNKTALPVQVTTRSIHRVAPNAQFWNGLPHDEWYPPTPLDLLEVILNVLIPERLKRDIIVQFVLDYIRCSSIPEDSENCNDKKLAIEVIKIMSNQTLSVDLEKVYCMLEEERLSLQKQPSATQQDITACSKNVFSLEEEGLSYEKLWSGEVNMSLTIKPSDLEKFKNRMKMQLEAGGESKKKLAVLDTETEKMYQVYLYENQKYHLMSAEAIASNEHLTTFFSKSLQKDRRPLQKSQQKTAKELEIEKSVKEMFEKQYKRNQLEIPQVYAGMGGEKNGGVVGRKRRSEIVEDDRSTSPVTFVPPTAKRIQQHVKTPENAIIESLTEVDPVKQNQNHQLNQMIATPARYYRRPVPVVEMSSPTDVQKAPPLPKQNSILKTAKAIQSPGRGRIRFHASVRKGPNESIDSTLGEPGDVLPEEEVKQPTKIDFMVLEDEADEQPTYKRRTRSSSMTQEAVTPQPQLKQMEILEEEIQETTFELQEEDEHIKSLDEAATYEDVEMEKTSEVEDEIYHESVLEEAVNVQKMQDVPDSFDDPEWDGIERSFEQQNDDDCDARPAREQPNFKTPILPPSFEGEPEEVSKDSDAANLKKDEEKSENLNPEEIDQEISQDVPLDRTFEMQEEEDPKPLGDSTEDIPGTSETFIVESKEIAEREILSKNSAPTDELELFDRPPSANTRSRSRTDSRAGSVTPEEDSSKNLKSNTRKPRATGQTSKTSETRDEDSEIKSVTRSTSRTRTIAKTLEIQVEEDDEAEAKRPSSRTRVARTASKTRETVENSASPENVGRKTRSSSVPRSTKKVQLTVEEDTTATEAVRPSSRSRRGAASVINDTEQDEVVNGNEKEETRPTSRTRRAASVKKDMTVEETPRASARRTPSRTRNRKNSEIVIQEEPNDPVEEEKRPASRTRRAASVKRDSKLEETPIRRTPSRSRSRLNSEDNDKSEPVLTTSTRKIAIRAPSVIPEEAVVTKTTRGRKASEHHVTPTVDALEDNVVEKESSKRVGTRTTRATSVQPEISTPAPSTLVKKTTRGSASAPSTPKRASKRRNISEDDQEGPSAKGRSIRATPLMSIPEAEEVSITPKRGRPRSISTSSVPATPKQGRKATSVATSLDDVVEEEEEASLSVRRSARRPKKP